MSAQLSVTGKMTFPNSPGGSTTPVLIGTPLVTPATSAAGSLVDYNEKAEHEFKILAGATKALDLGTVSSAAFVYLGADNDCTYKLNGGSQVFTLAKDGYVILKGQGITGLEITAGILDVKGYALFLGD